jgi:hypothetical protein
MILRWVNHLAIQFGVVIVGMARVDTDHGEALA